MVGLSGGDSHSISHSWPHDSQASVTLTRGRPGTVPLCARHLRQSRTLDTGAELTWPYRGTEADCTTAHQCSL